MLNVPFLPVCYKGGNVHLIVGKLKMTLEFMMLRYRQQLRLLHELVGVTVLKLIYQYKTGLICSCDQIVILPSALTRGCNVQVSTHFVCPYTFVHRVCVCCYCN